MKPVCLNFIVSPPAVKSAKPKHISNCAYNNDTENLPLNAAGEIAKQEIQSAEIKEEKYFKEFLSRQNKLTKEEYLEVKNNHPASIMKAFLYSKKNYWGTLDPMDLAIVADKVDKYLKENYKDCKIISLGTSPAALCEQLECLGHEIIYVPVSGLQYYSKDSDKIDNLPNLKAVLDYIKSKSTDNNKDIIILDYVSSGKTLDTMTELVGKYCNIPEEKLIKLPLNALLKKAFEKDTVFDSISKARFIEDVGFCEIENLGNVPHFSVMPKADSEYQDKSGTVDFKNKTQEELFKEFENYTQPLARDFALSAMHEYNRINNS